MFITFEGPEGSGKTTLIRALAAHIQECGRAVTVTREPGAGEFGQTIRSLVLHGEHLSAQTETFLFLADRSHHAQTLIRPALERGYIVLCDRHADSTVAYQGYGRGEDVEQLREWNRIATGGLSPDMTILLDLPVEIGLARVPDKDRIDSDSEDFHRRVRDGFLTEARADPQRWVVLDATASPDAVLENAKAAVHDRLFVKQK